MNVAIIGTGYVGLTTGACLAFLGHNVSCVDADEKKIAALCRGEVPFYEPHLEDLLSDAKRNLGFTTEYTEAIPKAQVIFIAVGTPPGVGGAPDLRYLEAAAHGVGQNLVQVGDASRADLHWYVRLSGETAGANPVVSRSRPIRSSCARAPQSTTACIRTAW